MIALRRRADDHRRNHSAGHRAFASEQTRSVAHGGTSSGHITGSRGVARWIRRIEPIIRADDYRGKRVRYSAYVKTRGVAGERGRLVDARRRKRRNAGVRQHAERAVGGTTDWKLVSVVLDVPNDAAGITFGFLLASAGEAWVDDASLEVVSADVPSTNTAAPMSNPDLVEQQRKTYETRPLTPLNMGFEPG